MEYPKKLIEVALPLDDINAAATREKSIRHGHPSTLHLWWARRPLAVARAVLFAQLVNDPGGKRGYGVYRGQSKDDAYRERERLFDIIRDLVKWENTNNEEILERARIEIRKSWRETCALTGDDPEEMPPFLDPFAGGGTIPLEAQRLGMESHASDLNPVAVMINKAMIEIPPKFTGRDPVGPELEGPKQKKTHKDDWTGAKGLAEDVRRYGYWMQKEAWRRIGHLYPQVEVSPEMAQQIEDLKGLVGQKLTVIAWLWTRTVKCSSPACGCQMPLLSSFVLSSKKGKETYLVPRFDGALAFDISSEKPTHLGDVTKGYKRGISGVFECINCGSVTSRNYTAEQATTVGLGTVQTAVVCEGVGGRIFLSAKYARIPKNIPEVDKSGLLVELSPNPRDVWCRNFGLNTPADLFSPRQLVGLTTFSDLITEARLKVIDDAKRAGWVADNTSFNAGGSGATAYGDALAVYLTFAINKMADRGSTICSWDSSRSSTRNTFGRQAIPMTWDFAESNPFSSSTGNFTSGINWAAKVLANISYSIKRARVCQRDAAMCGQDSHVIISTDPPYYDNIGYADLSDYFYVWLRRSLGAIFPDIFSTMLVPKEPELVATPYRHGSKEKAEIFFMEGMTKAINNMAVNSHLAFPVTIYYAFKQSETKAAGTASTGWVTFLEAVIKAGFVVTGTWPMRTELSNRMVGAGTNALASSIVLVCRKRANDAPTVSRRQFLRDLDQTLPEALEEMIGGTEGISPVAPVDLAQAAIGPGMAVFSRYEAVLEADGSGMSVHTALILINKAIDEYFTHAESDMGSDTRFCVDWFLQYGFASGQFGEADVLARAKGTTVDGVAQAGVVESGRGKVRLLRIEEYSKDWDPERDKRIPIWEACHQLCRALRISETEAGVLLARMKEKGEPVRQLAYRLYTQCERKGWAEDARVYNELITSWPAILEEARKGKTPGQMKLPGHE